MGEQHLIELIGASCGALLIGLLIGSWRSDLRHGQRHSLLTSLLTDRDSLAARAAELGFGTTDLARRISAVREEIKLAEVDIRVRRKHYDQQNETLNELWQEALKLKRSHTDVGRRIKQLEHAVQTWRRHGLLLNRGVEHRQAKLHRLERAERSGPLTANPATERQADSANSAEG